ncbi:MAG: hypothetical protein U9R25_07030 [Chloroflexota bacterium]|nr:hypothetical protein [Chloroflexota bacterium]
MWKRRSLSLALMGIIISMLAACGPEGIGSNAASPEPPPVVGVRSAASTPESLEIEKRPTIAQTPEVVEPVLSRSVSEVAAAASAQRLISAVAINDLSQRLGVSTESIEVVEAAEMEWPDASLGCPAPDMGYAQMLTNGMQVVLQVEGRTYAYHGRSPNDLFLCGPDGPVQAGKAPVSLEDGDQDQQTKIVATVAADLGKRLTVSTEEIEVVSVQSRDWPNSGLGCSQPNQRVMDVITPGYQIVLQSGDTTFTYHTDLKGNFVLCEKGKP